MVDRSDQPYNALNDPGIKGAAAAWHDLIDTARSCAEMAGSADTSRFDVTDDYPAARDQLAAALVDCALFEVHEASVRFQAAILTDMSVARTGTSGQEVVRGMGVNELALMGAVMMLRGALIHLQEALDQLPHPE